MSRRFLLAAATIALAACSAEQPAAPAGDPSRDAARAAITDYATLLMFDGTPEEAFHKYFGDLLVQHNPLIGDGGTGDVEFLAKRREAEPEKYAATEQYVNVVHNILTDGKFVVLKSHVFTNPADKGREFLDIWRVENGKFVEHWDVIRPLGAADANTIGCGFGADYQAAVKAGNTIAKPVCGSPDPAADSAASEKVVRAYLTAQPSAGSAKIERVVADGDLVLVHSLVAGEPRGIARAVLFRVANGKIADQWTVDQPIPEFSVSGRSMTGGPDDPLEPGRVKRAPKAGE
jgi:predicted SnoaL-like aldol condensation-catalyzing enzyme